MKLKRKKKKKPIVKAYWNDKEVGFINKDKELCITAPISIIIEMTNSAENGKIELIFKKEDKNVREKK